MHKYILIQLHMLHKSMLHSICILRGLLLRSKKNTKRFVANGFIRGGGETAAQVGDTVHEKM
jgi:hypothetical protein